MLRIILFSLLFLFTKNQENNHKTSTGNNANLSSMQSFDHGNNRRKLLSNDSTSAPTFGPTTIDSLLYKEPIINTNTSPFSLSKEEWDLIYAGIGVGGVLLLASIYCGAQYTYRKCKEQQQHAIAYNIEVDNKSEANNNKLNITV